MPTWRNLSLGLQFKSGFVGAALLEMRIIPRSLRVHQIEIEIIDAAGFKLTFEEGTDISLGLEEIRRQLVGQYVAVARIAAGKTGFQCFLALALQISVRGVKIVEARVQKSVNHTVRLGYVNFAVLHRQTHTSEAEIFPDLIHLKNSFPFHKPVLTPDDDIRHLCPMFRGQK